MTLDVFTLLTMFIVTGALGWWFGNLAVYIEKKRLHRK